MNSILGGLNGTQALGGEVRAEEVSDEMLRGGKIK
jgi:hypothetical protein